MPVTTLVGLAHRWHVTAGERWDLSWTLLYCTLHRDIFSSSFSFSFPKILLTPGFRPYSYLPTPRSPFPAPLNCPNQNVSCWVKVAQISPDHRERRNCGRSLDSLILSFASCRWFQVSGIYPSGRSAWRLDVQKHNPYRYLHGCCRSSFVRSQYTCTLVHMNNQSSSRNHCEA